MTKSIIEQELEKYERDGWSGDASALSMEDTLKAIKIILQKAEKRIDTLKISRGELEEYKSRDTAIAQHNRNLNFIKQILHDCFGVE